MSFKFERLIVCQKSVILSGIINQLAKKFPHDELYILTSQIMKAGDSVSFIIAAGSTGYLMQNFPGF